MGVNLVLTHKGKVIADLGRASHFRDCVENIETNIETLNDEINELQASLTLRASAYLGYQPKNCDDLDEIQERLREFIEHTIEEVAKVGERVLLATILEEKDMGCKIK